MHIVSHKAIRLFSDKHPDAAKPLDHWYRVAKRAAWANFPDVKQLFNTADFAPPYIVFDIGGNKYRLVAEMNYIRSVLYIRAILTHKEYDRGAWKP